MIRLVLVVVVVMGIMYACSEKPNVLCYTDGSGASGYTECCTTRGSDGKFSHTAICDDGTTRTITDRWIEDMEARAMSID